MVAANGLWWKLAMVVLLVAATVALRASWEHTPEASAQDQFDCASFGDHASPQPRSVGMAYEEARVSQKDVFLPKAS